MKFEADDPRRRVLIQMLAAGFFGGGSAAANLAFAQILGSPPSKLPEGKSIYRISGDVTVNGQKAALDTKIAGGSTIQTGHDSELVYAVGQSAYIARPNTQIVVETSATETSVVTGLRLLAGKLLSVFPSRRPVQLQTKTASIGIRGTGVYLESEPDQTYFCTCYGVADVAALDDPTSRETVAAQHHDTRSTSSPASRSAGRSARPRSSTTPTRSSC